MSYLATATNAVIDTTNIKTIMVQGELGHPVIRFTLDPALTGLAWRVRGSFVGTPYYAQSVEITPTETETAVTVDWTVSSDFTAYHGEMQLTLVGTDGSTEIVKFLGTVAIQQDLSIENTTPVTQNFFDQLLAQAAAAISKYPIIDDGDGNWYTYNVTTEVYEDTGVHAQGVRGSQTFSGDAITGTSTTPTAYATGITLAYADDRYRNTDALGASYQNEYICTLGGNAATALWAYDGNVRGVAGETGEGVAAGGTTNQALVKSSATDFDTAWADISTERTATLAAASWVGASAPYSQDITVTGVTTAGKPPIIDVVLSDTYATALNELTAYGLVYRFKVTADNAVTAYATAIPATDINIHAKLVM